MKNTICLFCLVLSGCITEYIPAKISQTADILVVEGIITNDETLITLSRSTYLTDTDNGATSPNYVSGAKIYVECDDGTQMAAEPQNPGIYLIKTGKLNYERKYRLKIETEEKEADCNEEDSPCPTKTYEYCSGFSYPIVTSEIDSVFRMQKSRGEPVTIHVSTQSSTQSSGEYNENTVLYYLWSYVENWEIIPILPRWGYPSVCWNEKKNTGLLLGSATKTVSGNLIDDVTEIDPSDSKLSDMYRITVKQNAISKQAYDYFSNIKKNAQQTGSIFSPIPLELKGNITCTTDPGIPVIGYVEVSTTTKKQLYISQRDNLYEPPPRDCQIYTVDDLKKLFNTDQIPPIPSDYTLYQEAFYDSPALYAKKYCVECDGTTQKPDDWPN